MNLTYLDNGFYVVSDKDAGVLCKDIGGLPRHGYEKRVKLPDGRGGWLSRTPVRAAKRGWRWAVYSLYPINN